MFCAIQKNRNRFSKENCRGSGYRGESLVFFYILDSQVHSIFVKGCGQSEMIYYNFVDGPVTVEWVDEETLVINSLVLTIHEDKYDFRKEK